jgi:serine phosphatase RsbU (regulator of sigma subunit)
VTSRAADAGGERIFSDHVTWQRQLLVVGVLGALLTFFVAACAVFTLAGTVRTGHELGQLSRAQRYHQDADMMHDALRADVANAEEAARTGSATAKAQVLAATQRHARQLQGDLNAMLKLQLSPSVRQALRSVRQPREAYAELSVRLVRAWVDEGRVSAADEARFVSLFNALTSRQAAVTTTVADTSATVESRQSQHEREVTYVLAVASAAALTGWGFLVVMLRRSGLRLFSALRREAEQRTVADELRRSLLPERLPEIPGVRLAARSRPRNSAMRIGGDWYDVISLPSGDIGLVVGDVVGHGIHAATAMAQLRAALRAFAVYEASPAAVLTRVNTVAEALEVTELTTCVYAVVDPATRAVRWSSAGHLNPLAINAEGAGRLLAGDPGPPIGVSTSAVYVDRTWHMDRQGSLMLYTDGLVERRSGSISDNLTRLTTIRGASSDPDDLCDYVLTLLLADVSQADDDVTVLAVQAA